MLELRHDSDDSNKMKLKKRALIKKYAFRILIMPYENLARFKHNAQKNLSRT